MIKLISVILNTLLYICILSAHVYAEAPLANEAKVEKLKEEALKLFGEGNSIDGRSKLQEALAIEPDNIDINQLLGVYYLVQIKHHKLAHRYLLNAYNNFEKKHGTIPKSRFDETWSQHARLIMLLSEAELSLDNYQEALKYVNKFQKYYYDPSMASSEAWILMKLGNREKAIQVAKDGILAGAEPTRTYNVLGILYSVTGKLDQSIKAFKSAIEYEKTKGPNARLSTPLNNLAEVYRELFNEEKSEELFNLSISDSKDCDHALPSVNLAMMLIDQLQLRKADRVLNEFENCFNQDPLKKDSEHKTLMALMKGRVLIRTGNIENAIVQYLKANDEDQSFGRIGSSINDLKVAAKLDLAQALISTANLNSLIYKPTIYGEIDSYFKRYQLRTKASQLIMEAKSLLFNSLSDFEDLYTRNSDSFIEYPTLSILTNLINTDELKGKVNQISKEDKRSDAQLFYNLYIASNLISNGNESQGLELLEDIEEKWKESNKLEKIETSTQILKTLKVGSNEYIKRTSNIFKLLPSYLPFNGLKTPVELFSKNNTLNKYFKKMFYLCSNENKCPLSIKIKTNENGIKINMSNNNEFVSEKEISNKCLNDYLCLEKKMGDFYFTTFYKFN